MKSFEAAVHHLLIGALMLCTGTGAIAGGKQVSLSQGLIAYFPLNGNAKDASGNGNDGSATRVVFGPDRFGNANAAADFSSGNAWVDVPSLDTMAYTPVTYSVWFKLNSYPTEEEHRPGGFIAMTLVGRELSGSFEEGALCFYDPVPRGAYNSIAYYTGTADVPGQQTVPTNQWTQVVFTLDASNNANFYLNGQLISSQQYTYPQGDVIPFRIGASASLVDWRYGWRGLLDDVRVYNRALSSDEVAQLFARETVTTIEPPTITTQPQSQTVSRGATVTFTVEASGPAPLGYQWSKDGVILAGATESSFSITNVQAPNIGDYTVVVSNVDGAVTSSVAALRIPHVPPDISTGLVAYFPFEGDAADASGNGNDGSPTNVRYGKDRFGRPHSAADFSSGDAWVDVPTLNAMDYTPVTYSAWFKLNSYPTQEEFRPDGFIVMTLVGREQSGAFEQGALCLYNPGPRGAYNSIAYYTGTADVPGQQTVPTNRWTQVVFTLDASNNATFYLNGELVSSQQYTYPQGDVIPFRIGASAALIDWRYGWRGLIDDVRIYNRAMKAREVLQLYKREATLAFTPPFLERQPVGQTALVGAAARFTVTANGGKPLSYQWMANSQPIAGATASELVIAHVKQRNAGTYSVVVSNAVGSVISSGATLEVRANPFPAVAGVYEGLFAETDEVRLGRSGFVEMTLGNLGEWTVRLSVGGTDYRGAGRINYSGRFNMVLPGLSGQTFTVAGALDFTGPAIFGTVESSNWSAFLACLRGLTVTNSLSYRGRYRIRFPEVMAQKRGRCNRASARPWSTLLAR